MKKDPLISVIIPVYNVEKYVQKCLDSVTNQSYHNLEIILVDDGSTDSSGKICDTYAKKDERITVIHQKNQGLSEARNNGMKVAHGKYTTFIDSDDYIHQEMIMFLYKTLKQYQADIATCTATFVYENGACKAPKEDLMIEVHTSKEALELMLYQTKINNSAWGKLYKTSLLDNITYPRQQHYEDVGTTYKILRKATQVVITNAPYYFYLQRTNSIARQFNKKTFDIIKQVHLLQKDLMKTHPGLENAINSRVLNADFFVIRQLKKKEYKKEYFALRQEIKQLRGKVLRDSKVRKKTKMGIILSYLGIPVMRVCYNLLEKCYFLKKLD